MVREETYYEALGLVPGAPAAVITAAYRALSKQLHPDRPGGDAARFALVNAAHDVLRDPATRAAYDRRLEAEAAAAVAPEPSAPVFEDWGEADDVEYEHPPVHEPDLGPVQDLPWENAPTPVPVRRGRARLILGATLAALLLVTGLLVWHTGGAGVWAWAIAFTVTSIWVFVSGGEGKSLPVWVGLLLVAWLVDPADGRPFLDAAAFYLPWGLPGIALVASLMTEEV